MLIKLKFVISNMIWNSKLTFIGKFKLNSGICTINCKVLTMPQRNCKLADLNSIKIGYILTVLYLRALLLALLYWQQTILKLWIR